MTVRRQENGAQSSGWSDWGRNTIRDEFRRGGRQILRGAISKGVQYGSDQVFGAQRTKTGAEVGDFNREMQEAQYPGTNPWERLGAPGASGGPIEISKQERANKHKIATQQVDQAQRSSEIQGRAAGIQAGANFGPGKAMDVADYVISGTRPPPLGKSAPYKHGVAALRTSAAAYNTSFAHISNAQQQKLQTKINAFKSETERLAHELKGREHQFNVGKFSGDPATAALIGLSSRAHELFRNRTDKDRFLNSVYDELLAAGTAAHVLKGIFGAANVHLARFSGRGVKNFPKDFKGPTSVRGRKK